MPADLQVRLFAESMSSVATIPIIIEPEVTARVAELGMTEEFQLMLDHARQVIPRLQQIRVTLEPPYDTDDEPRVVTEVLQGGPFCDYGHFGTALASLTAPRAVALDSTWRRS